MRAKTVNQLIKEHCSEIDNSEDVEEILSFYWSYTRKLMVSKQHPLLFLVGLGEFTINRKKLASKIAKTHQIIQSLDKKDYIGIAKYTELEKKLATYQELQTKSYELVHKRNHFKQALLNDTKDQNNLEE